MSHAPFSPSAASRWLECPQSVLLSEKVEEVPPGEAAERGTRIHEQAELYMTEGTPPDNSDEGWIAAGFVEFVEREFIAEDYVDYLSEFRVYSEEPEALFGTADAVLYGEGLLHVIDLKTGRTPVQTEGNPQLYLYAHMALQNLMGAGKIRLEPKQVKITIYQHSDAEREASVVSAMVDVPELNELMEDALEAVRNTKDFPLNPGKACTFCPARAVCPALQNIFTDVEQQSTPAKELETKELLEIQQKFKLTRAYMEGVEKELELRAESMGESFPAERAVTRTAITWRNRAQVEALLRENGYEIETVAKAKLPSPRSVLDQIDVPEDLYTVSKTYGPWQIK